VYVVITVDVASPATLHRGSLSAPPHQHLSNGTARAERAAHY